jgi:hypothetical protein
MEWTGSVCLPYQVCSYGSVKCTQQSLYFISVTVQALRGWGSSPGRVKNYYFSISSRPALGSTQPPIQWVPILLRQTANRRRKVVSPTRRPHFTPRFPFFFFKYSWYSFLLEAESTPGPVRPEELGQFKKSTSSGLEPATFRLAA